MSGGPTEAADLLLIAEYFGLDPASPEMQAISGLPAGSVRRVLDDPETPDSPRRAHIAVVAAIVDALARARRSATGSARRKRPASTWLAESRVRTSAGLRSPLEVLADEQLALEELDRLQG